MQTNQLHLSSIGNIRLFGPSRLGSSYLPSPKINSCQQSHVQNLKLLNIQSCELFEQKSFCHSTEKSSLPSSSPKLKSFSDPFQSSSWVGLPSPTENTIENTPLYILFVTSQFVTPIYTITSRVTNPTQHTLQYQFVTCYELNTKDKKQVRHLFITITNTKIIGYKLVRHRNEHKPDRLQTSSSQLRTKTH